jgi:hypothetical protein
MVSVPLSAMSLRIYFQKIYIRLYRLIETDEMPQRPKRIIRTEYFYSSDSESDESWVGESESESESEEEEDEEVSDSEDGTDYESETEPESDSEELDDPKPYFGKGFRVYFDSHGDKKFFMKAFGFCDA